MKQLLFKVCLFLAYSCFAGYSAFMTATSIQLKWMSQVPFLLVFVMVFIISLGAGWCLNNIIKQLKSQNASITRLVLNVVGFLMFWLMSFMTNVHYNVIQEKGATYLSAQLEHCKRYLQDNDQKAIEIQESEKHKASIMFENNIFKLYSDFEKEMRNESGVNGGLVGLGPKSIGILESIERALNNSARLYNDDYDYTGSLYNKVTDGGLIGKHDRRIVEESIKMFAERINVVTVKHNKAIEYFYDKRISNIKSNKKYLKDVAYYEKEIVKLDTTNDSDNYVKYYDLSKSMDKNLFSKVSGYKESYEIYKKDKNGKYVTDNNGNKIVIGYKDVYPSSRLFDVMNMWHDWFSGDLPDEVSLSGQFLWSVIVDVMAFILICLI